jgi:inosose dehydratase
LEGRKLELLGAFVPVAFVNESAHAEGEARAVKTAKLMADAAGSNPFLVLADDNGKDPLRTKNAGRIEAADSLTPKQWETFGKGVNRVAEAIRRQTGLRTVFHHHCAGFVETPWEIEALLRATDPNLVGLCFDTGHYRFGGGPDPAAALHQFRDRTWHVHFKDCSPAMRTESKQKAWDYFESLKHGIFCELGKGDVDFPAVTRELRATGYEGWIVVEQDVLPGMGAPKEYARRNREYLRKCGL